ncbi:hypothetical protein BJV82DRAFT_614714 [Fennellomyces sp. T-0311]|nr:hypothetical protein BJV82DRAFT_614714 [Fennellomyces sp. T-0311]
MANKKQNQGNKKLQDQVQRLSNELEELRLECEESKKNVVHFMQEADLARQELEKAQGKIAQLTQQMASQNGEQGGLVTATSDTPDNGITRLVVKLQQLNDRSVVDRLWNELDGDNTQKQQLESVTQHLQEAIERIQAVEKDKQKLEEDLEVARSDENAARQARDIEHERAETLEKRWQTSESDLEQAEMRIQSLERDLDALRQKEWVAKAPSSQLVEKTELDAKCRELHDVQTQFEAAQGRCQDLQKKLEKESSELANYREKQSRIEEKLAECKELENQQHALEQAKIRESHLKTINKTLRDEIRKVSSRNDMEVNMEYLKNVIIKFLEKKQTRAQLIPVLSTLLQCSREEQLRLNKLVRNKVSS